MSQRNKQSPTDWSAYEHGRTSSFGSLESVPEDDQPRRFFSTSAPRDIPQRDGQGDGGRLRRKSSLGKRFDSIRQMGGPNSIDNFAKSFQRAAGFREITPVRRNSVTLPDADQEADPDAAEQSTTQNRSLLRQQLLRYDMDHDSSSAVQDEPSEVDDPTEASRLLPSQSRHTLKSHSGSLVPGSLLPSQYATSYGSISSKLTVTARQRASILIMEQEEASRRAREDLDDEFKEEPPRLVEQEVRPDGEVIQRIVGESTVPMTVFNSTNVLIGVGILALPLGIKYSGWVLGLSFLTLSALATSYTAKLLARCLDTNTGSSTYGDIAYLAFDTMGRNFVESLFILELTGANVAMIILFADSMSSLITGFDNVTWKVIIAIGLIPLNFVPFKYLSFTSVIGIFCCLTIVVIIFADGLIKPHAPGSLREISKTYAFPENWATVPLSLGLIMAPWGGHSVFPAVYKDMRHPQKYVRAVRYTYIFTYGLDASMAVLGYLMFGEGVMDEVTANILRSTAYPHALSIIIVMLIAVIPITKIPLSNRPMQDTVNKKFYIDLRQMDHKARARSEKSWKHRTARASVGILANLAQLAFAIFFPDFDSLMALLGSLFCFTVCIILPVSFYLKIFSSEGKEIGRTERLGCWALLLVSTALAILGTVFAIVPKETFGISK
jgi:vesicular inhibitory amino acid transporter